MTEDGGGRPEGPIPAGNVARSVVEALNRAVLPPKKGAAKHQLVPPVVLLTDGDGAAERSRSVYEGLAEYLNRHGHYGFFGGCCGLSSTGFGTSSMAAAG